MKQKSIDKLIKEWDLVGLSDECRIKGVPKEVHELTKAPEEIMVPTHFGCEYRIECTHDHLRITFCEKRNVGVDETTVVHFEDGSRFHRNKLGLIFIWGIYLGRSVPELCESLVMARHTNDAALLKFTG